MSKHLIKIESTAHGVLGVRHAGLDQQYCEAGELVILKWQPDAKWGLQEAHYTDDDGNVVAIEGGEFVMPDKGIVVGGTFKRFVVEDWKNYEGTEISGGVEGDVLQVGSDGKPAANPKVIISAKGDVSAGRNVSAKGDVSAKGNVSADGYLQLKDTASGDYYKVEVTNGALVVTAL